MKRRPPQGFLVRAFERLLWGRRLPVLVAVVAGLVMAFGGSKVGGC